MKRALLLPALLTVVLAAWPARAQSNGVLRATTTLHPDGTRTVSIVDPDKHSSEETDQDANGKILRKTTYLLDDRSQAFGSITYDAKGVILYRTSYRRDNMGRIDEESITTAAGQPLRRRVYTYGAGNKVTNIEEFDANGNPVVPPRAARADKKKR
jgi:hypothetical protein